MDKEHTSHRIGNFLFIRVDASTRLCEANYVDNTGVASLSYIKHQLGINYGALFKSAPVRPSGAIGFCAEASLLGEWVSR